MQNKYQAFVASHSCTVTNTSAFETMAKVHTWLNPILICVIGFFSIYTLNGVNNRLDKLESKMDEIMYYKVILQQIAERKLARLELPPFKHEDFITLKIEDDEIGII